MPLTPTDLRLAQRLGARLCHDLSGPAGSAAAALSLLEDGGDDATEVRDLARDAVDVLLRRLRLWRALMGGGDDLALPDLLSLLEGQMAGGRVRVAAEGLATQGEAAMVPAAAVPLLLLGALLAGEGLPRDGTVQLSGDIARGVAVLPEGPGAAWPPALAASLAGRDSIAEAGGIGGTREVLASYLAALATDRGLRVDLLLGPGEGPGPLLIGCVPARA